MVETKLKLCLFFLFINLFTYWFIIFFKVFVDTQTCLNGQEKTSNWSPASFEASLVKYGKPGRMALIR